MKYKYVSDFFLFLQESKEEDFYVEEQGVICISTIHKSKGREFDSVVLYLKDYDLFSEESKRVLYVGMTRAREQLEIHCNVDLPNLQTDVRYQVIEQMSYEEDHCTYMPCGRIIFQAGYRDVYLSYFGKTQQYIKNVVSGNELVVDEKGCRDIYGKRILLFSTKFKEEINRLQVKGYQLSKARVRHMFYWMAEGAESEIMVLLPEIEMIMREKNFLGV